MKLIASNLKYYFEVLISLAWVGRTPLVIHTEAQLSNILA